MSRKIIDSKERVCVDCGKEYAPTDGAYNRCGTHYQVYRRRNDLSFFLNEKYTSILKRIRSKTEKNHYGLSVCSREHFMDFSYNDRNLLDLWSTWGDFEYSLKSCPSIDRIDSNKGYVEGNLQWITQSENSARGQMVAVEAYLEGKLVGIYESKKEAGEDLGVHPANIYKVYTGLRKSTGGYTFKKVEYGS